MKIYQGQPGTGDAVLATIDRLFDSFAVVAANTTGTAATLTLNLVYGGGAAASTNRIASAVSVAANSVAVLDFPLQLTRTDQLRGLQGTGSALTVTIDGVDGNHSHG